MSLIFISHAIEDREPSRQLARDLKLSGLTVLRMEEDGIFPGFSWKIPPSPLDCLVIALSAVRGRYVSQELAYVVRALGKLPPNSVDVYIARLKDLSVSRVFPSEAKVVDLFPSWDNGIDRLVSIIVRRSEGENGQLAPSMHEEANLRSGLPQMRELRSCDYDVALSFAGEDREYVEKVAEALKEKGVRTFYDRYEQASLWGNDLYGALDEVYRIKAHLCLMFISKHYVSKVWTSHERKSAQARALTEESEYILPIRFDESEVPGLRPTVSYLLARDWTAFDLAEAVTQKLCDTKRRIRQRAKH
jgi:hypothetical protein